MQRAGSLEKTLMQEEKAVTEADTVGWRHRLNGHESEQTQGNSEGQGGLACCNTWSCRELDTIEQQQSM